MHKICHKVIIIVKKVNKLNKTHKRESELGFKFFLENTLNETNK